MDQVEQMGNLKKVQSWTQTPFQEFQISRYSMASKKSRASPFSVALVGRFSVDDNSII